MSLKFRRQLRVEKQLLQVIARQLISSKFKTRLSGIVSVSNVKVSHDLRLAKVFIRTLGSIKEQEKNLKEIIRNVKEIQRQVTLELKMKFYPRLEFLIDKDLEGFLNFENFLHNQLK